MSKEKLIKLMQENPEEFNRQREKYDYPELIIEKQNDLTIRGCNLKNVVFQGCNSGSWKYCREGSWKFCLLGKWESCREGEWEACREGRMENE